MKIFKTTKKITLGLLGAALLLSATVGQAEDLRVLQVAPMSGNLQATGAWLNQTLTSYAEEIQKQGYPHKIQIKTVDDGYVPEKTLSLAKESSAAFKPHAMFGLVGTANLKLLLEKKFFDEQDVPLVGVRTGAPLYHSNVIHLRASYASEVAKLMELMSIQGFERVGVIYQNDEFGQDGLASAEKTVLTKATNLKIVAKAYYTRNTVEVGAAVKSMVDSEPKAVLVVGNTNATAAIVDALKKSMPRTKLFTVSVVDPLQIVEKIKDNAQGLVIAQVVPNLYDPRFPLATEFKKFAERNKLPANPTVFEGYIMARVLFDAAKNVKGPLTAQTLKRELRSKPVILGGMKFNLPEEQRTTSFADTLIIGSGNQLYY